MRLARADKWFLTSGKGAVFAPPFPRYLDRIGFWDEVYLADLRLDRLFTVLITDDEGVPIDLRGSGMPYWNVTDFGTLMTPCGRGDIFGEEKRMITPGNTFASQLQLTNGRMEGGALVPQRIHLLLWSLPEAKTVVTPEVTPERLVFGQRFTGEKGEAVVQVALGASLPRTSYTVNLAERTATEPLWNVSVFPEKFTEPALPNEFQTGGDWTGSLFGDSLLHLCQHYILDMEPGETATVTLGASVAFDRSDALAALDADLAEDALYLATSSGLDYFEKTPRFTSGDVYLDRYLPYRYYGLRLSTVDVNHAPFSTPCVFEGIGMFRSYISYSAQVHAREARWLQDGGRLAEGCLSGLLALQNEDGSIPGHTYTVRDARAFYHADWGDATLSVYAVTGNDDFLASIYPRLARYAEYFDRERDKEQSGLYDIIDQNETGQEYMSRYLFADPNADDWGPLRLKGVDATVYLYQLLRSLGQMERLLEQGDGLGWDERADRTKAAVLAKMWDPERQAFYDVHPTTGERSPYLSAVGFYPFITDLAGPEHLAAIERHLLNPEEFWTPYPVPASPLNDPYFNAQAEWKNKRTNCPWNGRVWPMINSHIADALANVARTMDTDMAPRAVEFIEKFVRMLFHDGDVNRPNAYEHYNPLTGVPSLYRGVDDYMHSSVADVMIRHLCGVFPQVDGTLMVDPLWRREEPWSIANLPCRGRTVAVTWEPQEGLLVFLDGEIRAARNDYGRLELDLSV